MVSTPTVIPTSTVPHRKGAGSGTRAGRGRRGSRDARRSCTAPCPPMPSRTMPAGMSTVPAGERGVQRHESEHHEGSGQQHPSTQDDRPPRASHAPLHPVALSHAARELPPHQEGEQDRLRGDHVVVPEDERECDEVCRSDRRIEIWSLASARRSIARSRRPPPRQRQPDTAARDLHPAGRARPDREWASAPRWTSPTFHPESSLLSYRKAREGSTRRHQSSACARASMMGSRP